MESNHSKRRPFPWSGYICDAQFVQLTNKIGTQTRNICNEKQHDYINVRSFSKFYLLRHTKRFVKRFVLICTRCHAWYDATIEPKNRILISTCKWKCAHWTSIAMMHSFEDDSKPPILCKLYWMFLLGTRCCSFIRFSNRRWNVNMSCFMSREQLNWIFWMVDKNWHWPLKLQHGS